MKKTLTLALAVAAVSVALFFGTTTDKAEAINGITSYEIATDSSTLQPVKECFENYAAGVTTSAITKYITSSGFSYKATAVDGFAPSTVTQPIGARQVIITVSDADTTGITGAVYVSCLNARGEKESSKHYFAAAGTSATSYACARIVSLAADSDLIEDRSGHDKISIGFNNHFGMSNRINEQSDIYRVEYRANAATWVNKMGNASGTYASMEAKAKAIGQSYAFTSIGRRGRWSLFYPDTAPNNTKDWCIWYNDRHRRRY